MSESKILAPFLDQGDFPMEKETTTIRQEALLAAALLAALAERGSKGLPKIEDVSALLFKLRNAGIDIGEVALRRVPGGFYSEDIEALIGHYLAAGYAEQMSPVKLTDKGHRVLEEIIELERKEKPEVLKRIESVLSH